MHLRLQTPNAVFASPTTCPRVHVRLALAFVLTTSMLLHAPNARAVLGAGTASIDADQGRMNGKRRMSVSASVQVHEISSANGSRVREFVAPNGTVFAVVWNTRFKPNLELLLGAHHKEYSAAAEAAKRPGIQRGVVLRREDLVVHSFAHLNTFAGRAYVPSLVPAGFNVDDIK